MTDISDSIDDLAVKPKSVTVDGQTVTQHPLGDLIEADKYLAAKRASAGKGFKLSTIVSQSARAH